MPLFLRAVRMVDWECMRSSAVRSLWIRLAVMAVLSGIQLGLPGYPPVAAAEAADLVFHASPHARFHFEGLVERRIQSNVDQWLLPAPQANPGMMEMFRLRDREPQPNLVPWAGEFAGKYLISGIQALRMAERPELRALITRLVTELVATQAEDGYLGPFPRTVRLKGNWDLWGHYHCMLALLMWHEATGDASALRACRRAADLICTTFLNSGLRVFDAGSHEMNMAVVHVLGRLHRLTHEGRYFQMMREIETDWQRAGDYFRTGLAGVEFFQTPRPRWESLHDLQGLVEFYRITGDSQYRTAFTRHWRSILRWDRRNTGGFSSGEQATGNPYAATPIETCCTVAWMALTTDMLQLTGELRAADELELSFFNAALGAQHPSGRWCTYNTPMDGAREASAHTIVFQSRAGSPELNCCSVNAPRGLGLLSEWAVLTGADALVVNYYGPGSYQGRVGENMPVALRWETDYPRAEKVALRVEPLAPRRFRMLLRIPSWSRRTMVELNGESIPNVVPGQYLELNRRWEPADRIDITFDFTLRVLPGDREALGRGSIYRGPLLLAYDQALNPFDEKGIPGIDLDRLSSAHLEPAASQDPLDPWLVLRLPGMGGQNVRVCDFASAGARGTRYRSWLPLSRMLPPVVVTRTPVDGATIPAGDTLFRWSGPQRPNEHVTEYQLQLAAQPGFEAPLLVQSGLQSNHSILPRERMAKLTPQRSYWWRVVAHNRSGATESAGPPSEFKVDPALPETPLRVVQPGPDGLLLADNLAGRPELAPERIRMAGPLVPAPGPKGGPATAVQTDGAASRLIYSLEEFPEEDYTASVWVNVERLPEGRLAQVCSAWCGPMDDPLRLCVENGKLFARLEAGQGYSTPGVNLEVGRWYHVAFLKSGTTLTLFLDGKARGQTTVPLLIYSRARDLALGGNPHYAGNEFLAARFARFTVYSRALTEREIVDATQW